MAFLLPLSVWIARFPPEIRGRRLCGSGRSSRVQVIKDLGVLENYDVLTKFDALSELPWRRSRKIEGASKRDDTERCRCVVCA